MLPQLPHDSALTQSNDLFRLGRVHPANLPAKDNNLRHELHAALAERPAPIASDGGRAKEGCRTGRAVSACKGCAARIAVCAQYCFQYWLCYQCLRNCLQYCLVALQPLCMSHGLTPSTHARGLFNIALSILPCERLDSVRPVVRQRRKRNLRVHLIATSARRCMSVLRAVPVAVPLFPCLCFVLPPPPRIPAASHIATPSCQATHLGSIRTNLIPGIADGNHLVVHSGQRFDNGAVFDLAARQEQLL